jgi:hypothetical protein
MYKKVESGDELWVLGLWGAEGLGVGTSSPNIPAEAGISSYKRPQTEK